MSGTTDILCPDVLSRHELMVLDIISFTVLTSSSDSFSGKPSRLLFVSVGASTSVVDAFIEVSTIRKGYSKICKVKLQLGIKSNINDEQQIQI